MNHENFKKAMQGYADIFTLKFNSMTSEQIKLEVNHIFEGGANEIRVISLIESVVSNYEKEVKRLQNLCTELVGMETAYQEGALFFGCRCTIEQKRHGVQNEHYTHKVIGELQSNSWVEVPVQTPRKEILHDEMFDVLLCICEGVDETEVRRYRRVDCKSMR